MQLRSTLIPYLLLLFGVWAGNHALGEMPHLLKDSRISGGICVWVGEAAEAEIAAIAEAQPFLVQWLIPARGQSSEQITKNRSAFRNRNLEGRVVVEAGDLSVLPYADQLVSLLVLGKEAQVSEAECLRVLRPFGELIDLRGAVVKRTVRPRPQGMDDWTHWRHAPDRNPVSRDSVVGVPDRIQWLLPSEVMSERSHLVTSNGRMFSQDRAILTARDACNGLPLWQARLKQGKEFDWEYSVKVSALVVAVGEQVYALMEEGKFVALDAATGQKRHEFTEAGQPYDAVVVERLDGKSATLVTLSDDAIMAFDALRGTLLWREPAKLAGTLIASSDRVFYIEGNDRKGAAEGIISARALPDGKLLWRETHEWARRTEQGALGNDRIVYEMRRPLDWRTRYEQDPKLKEEERYALVVISASTGAVVEKIHGTSTSARHGEFRAAFWHGENLVTEALLKDGINVVQFGLNDYKKPIRSFRTNNVGDRGFGHCYPPVLTERYYLNGQLNFVDLKTGSPLANQITRGGCNTARSGYIPANGMLYTFPKHCICYPMLDGNVALATGRSDTDKPAHPLVMGPAWPVPAVPHAPHDGDWPTFRHDASRTGGTATSVPGKLAVKWTAELAPQGKRNPLEAEWSGNPYTAGVLTAPVSAGGLVYLAVSDFHRLVAVRLDNGKVQWEFTAGGRMDTPPTIYHGLCLQGCRDGWIYCLRAADGALVWKLRAAPTDRRIAVHGQVESPWGVVGSILVTDGLAYAVAGLHPNSDGGIKVLAFSPETGQIHWQGAFDDLGFSSPWPAEFDPRVSRPESDPWRTIRPLEYTYNGLPVRDGDSVAVSRCVFDLKSGQRELKKTKGYYHIKETGVWLPRNAWRYATEREGAPQAVALGQSVFGTRPATSQLFRVDFRPETKFNDDWVRAPDVKQEISKEAFSINRLHDMGPKWEAPSRDSRREFNRAMLVAGDTVFCVTPKGLLTAHSTETGALLSEMKLETAVWNGLAAARGNLLVATTTGKLLCLGAKE